MKRKVISLTAFLSFWLSIIAIVGIAGTADQPSISLHKVIFRLSICFIVLAIDAVIVNKLFVDGEWRV